MDDASPHFLVATTFMGCEFLGLGFEVWGLGFEVLGLGLRVCGVGFEFSV